MIFFLNNITSLLLKIKLQVKRNTQSWPQAGFRYEITKEVISNQKQPSCKKGVASIKAMVNKDVKSKVEAKK